MKNNTNYLTSIRGLACLMVVIAHIISVIPGIGKNVSGCGKIGVWLFFILSAFLLTFQWLNKEDFKIKDVIEFYIKRIFRIFPCYIVTLIIAFLVGYITEPKTVMKHILLMEGMGHFWTIPVEFIFYILVPIIMFTIYKIRNEKKSILFLIILFMISAILSPYTLYEENSINIRWYLPVFLMGMILAFIYQKSEKKQKQQVIYDVIFFVMMLMMTLSIPYVRNLIFKIEPDSYLLNKYLYFGLAWSIVILAIQNSKYVIDYLNQSKILIYIEKISFSLYLIHFIVLNKIKGNNVWINSLLIFIISMVIAIIMNQLVEQPMIRLAKRINKKLRKEKKEEDNGKIQKNRNFN